MAAPIEANGKAVLAMRLRAPISGAWVARLQALTGEDEPLSGSVTISDGTNRWTGTVVRTGAVLGVCTALVVGGAGKLGDEPAARSYVGVTARSVVQDLLADAGEAADGRAMTRPELRSVLEHWTRSGVGDHPTTFGAELTRVLEAVGLTWRVLPSGAIWMGLPTFRVATPRGLVERTRDPDAGRVHTTLDLLDLLPDSSVADERVGDVEYQLSSTELRATYWLKAA